MSLVFRNVTATPSDPVCKWPTEAVQAALERGDLEHWQRLTAEIVRDPWGRAARQVEEILRHSRPYGIAELMELVIERARAMAEHNEREAVMAEIRQAIGRSGLTRAEFASRIGTSASRLSTYATGKVAPAATLMIRIRRVAERLEADASGCWTGGAGKPDVTASGNATDDPRTASIAGR